MWDRKRLVGSCDCEATFRVVFRVYMSVCSVSTAGAAAMEPHRLSAGKRLAKPLLFGTLVVGLAAAFFNRSDPCAARG